MGDYLRTLFYIKQIYSPKKTDLLSIIGVLTLLSGLLLLNENRSLPGWWALLPTIGTFLIISSGPKAWFNLQILSHSYVVWIGLISYPLYLWHWVLLSFAHILDYTSKEARLSVVVMSFIFAWLTFEIIEKRVRKSDDKRSATILILFSIIILFTGLIVRRQLTCPVRFPLKYR